MSDDRFFDRLREDARRLRFEPDPFAAQRVAARVRSRLASPPTAAQFLARWMRPLAASLSTIALVATLGAVWLERSLADNVQAELVTTAGTIEISAAGDVYRVTE